MAAVIVVGGGFAGMAVAARLAKLGHRVRLLESQGALGGRLRPTEQDGFVFDDGDGVLVLPAALRDLFRKSGRPLERVLDLRYLAPGRRHVFSDGSLLDLPNGSRADQRLTIDRSLGRGGAEWTAWLDDLLPVWDVLRDRAWSPLAGLTTGLDRSRRALLRPRRTLAREARARFRDRRLRALAVDDLRLLGYDPRAVPAFLAMSHLLDRQFGRWEVVGGSRQLILALTRRLEERGVEVDTRTLAVRVESADGRVRGVRTDREEVDAELVIWTPRADPAPLRPGFVRTHLGLRDGLSDLPAETVVHSDHLLRLSRSVTHGGPGQAWTVDHDGQEDPLTTLARFGMDVRSQVVVHRDVDPRREVGAESGSTAEPVSGLHRMDAEPALGRSIALLAMEAADVAASIGAAPRGS